MGEAPEDFYERVAGSLVMPPVEEWDTWPFEGELRPRALEPPLAAEPSRDGEGGLDCRHCSWSDDEYLWSNDNWRLWPFPVTPGLPVIVMLVPRSHYQEPGDLPDELAAELGVMLARIDRAVRSVGEIGRVHIGRWGEGSAHLHWWFMARPARIGQLRSSLAALWDDVLPRMPEEMWRANLDQVARAMSAED